MKMIQDMNQRKVQTAKGGLQPTRPRKYVYGVYGLTEWHPLIRVGKVRVRIPFTGGTMSAYGQVPATFTTSSDDLARVIEGSEHFKSHRIKRLK